MLTTLLRLLWWASGKQAETQPTQAANANASLDFVSNAAASAQTTQVVNMAALLDFVATLTSTQASQAEQAAALLDFLGVAGAAQAKQLALATALLDFIAAVNSSQAAQLAAATALLDLLNAGATSQAQQTAAVAAVEDFIATVGTVQAQQMTSESGVFSLVSTAGMIQAAQQEVIASLVDFLSLEGSAQSRQAAAISGDVFSNITGASATFQNFQVVEATASTPTHVTDQGGGTLDWVPYDEYYHRAKRIEKMRSIQIRGKAASKQSPPSLNFNIGCVLLPAEARVAGWRVVAPRRAVMSQAVSGVAGNVQAPSAASAVGMFTDTELEMVTLVLEEAA